MTDDDLEELLREPKVTQPTKTNGGTKKAANNDVNVQESISNQIDVVKSNISAALEESEQKCTENFERAAEAERRAAEAIRRAAEAEERAAEAESTLGERLRVVTQAYISLNGTKSHLEQQVTEQNERATRAEASLADCERRLRGTESRLVQEVREQNERATRAEESLADSEQRVRSIEKENEELSQQNEDTGIRLLGCEQRLQQLENQWVVGRDEVELTGPELGRGGWATVRVAIFRNMQVAAKSIHSQIVSPHNIELFRREMNMAARIRHPNLVQFIGAIIEVDEEMTILTELMPTSLRRELQHEYMPPSEVISIGLDVTRALNYLHQMQPDSIIHRDVSSANVLLEYKSRNRWKAKLSDYGSVNLLNQLQTVNPGNPTYSAPEANDPSQQSPKMDIFSFGALLLEMLTGVLPARELRERLLGRIHHEQLLDLIRRCLMERKEERPNASDIIIELERYASRH